MIKLHLQGGWQLEMDINFVSSCFQEYHSRPQIFFRDCLDAAKIFAVDEQTADEAARCIGRDMTDSPAPLKRIGVKLKVDMVTFILGQRV